MTDMKEHIEAEAKRIAVKAREEFQDAALSRLTDVLAFYLERGEYSLAQSLNLSLDAVDLVLVDRNGPESIQVRVDLDVYSAPRNLDEELDRLATKYGTEYLAEHLLAHPSHIADLQMLKAESEDKPNPIIVKQLAGSELSPDTVVKVLEAFLLKGEYFNIEFGPSPTLEVAVADAITYIREGVKLAKILDDDLK